MNLATTQEDATPQRPYPKGNRKTPRTPKKWYQGSPKQPPIQETGLPHTMITGTLNAFNTLILKKNFRKAKIFLKKLEYCFLVQRTMNEKA